MAAVAVTKATKVTTEVTWTVGLPDISYQGMGETKAEAVANLLNALAEDQIEVTPHTQKKLDALTRADNKETEK